MMDSSKNLTIQYLFYHLYHPIHNIFVLYFEKKKAKISFKESRKPCWILLNTELLLRLKFKLFVGKKNTTRKKLSKSFFSYTQARHVIARSTFLGSFRNNAESYITIPSLIRISRGNIFGFGFGLQKNSNNIDLNQRDLNWIITCECLCVHFNYWKIKKDFWD